MNKHGKYDTHQQKYTYIYLLHALQVSVFL